MEFPKADCFLLTVGIGVLMENYAVNPVSSRLVFKRTTDLHDEDTDRVSNLKARYRTLDEKVLKGFYMEMIRGHIRFSEPKKLTKL